MKSTPLSPRQASAWLTTLARPENRVELDFHNVPAFYTAEPGWNTEPRPFNQHLVYYVVGGSFRVRAGKHEETVKPSDLLWISPLTPFRCWLPDDKTASFYRFRLSVGKSRNTTFPFGIHIAREREAARRWIEEVVRTGHQSDAFRTWRLRGALLGLFAEAFAAASTTRGTLTALQKEDLALAISQKRMTPALLARQLRMSPDYFARLFRKSYGLSPRAWIVRERIKLSAVRLLESHLSVGEVAAEFGYPDIFFFSRQFKQVMGRSPLAYRREA